MSRQLKINEELAQYIIEQLALSDPISTRSLFGACALCRNEHVFGMVWKGDLYFKVDDENKNDYEIANSHTLGYVSKGEERALKSFWTVPAEVVENREDLRVWAEKAYRAAMKAAKAST
ncbi:TfoX/Sxy family protein [Paraburkholderia caribensis]|uniref:TfoX/Sxy family protein n=1 Tax=Paraburkholderia caribensis TaxID=75105 RepID=A0A9Q6S6H8_9BURK|nr:TfoX/Sxy family protein [Paraburkholderia caribensis]MCO4878288.1 TfoX/Sxy family protein [Paraburkholderia caribensis]PTB28614.1 TfoX/Sxy family transcriptional regulator [Paraburkholderia caribensis]QLB66082.1 hypothetical protein A9O66_27755 [Paraburkholderia caribensis]